MRREVWTDPYFDRQPEKTFVRELTEPLHRAKPRGFGETPAGPGEISAAGAYLAECFQPDPKGLLETSYADFRRFLAVTGCAGDRYPVRLRRGETECFEAWRVLVEADGVTVTAADTEGVRRALIWLEDEMLRRNGPLLPPGEEKRKPWMRLRVTRCFFSPINRPPKYGDELSDDVDYYPEEYLNRLMHDGANAVWIYTRFSDLVPSSYLPEYGIGGERRLAKLNRICARCARYGIKPYVFAIEPVHLTAEQMARVGADGGRSDYGTRLFCVNHPDGSRFVEELGRELFTRCPGLGGFISITYGERPTSCASAFQHVAPVGKYLPIQCPRCKNLTPGEVVASVARALAKGIHEANPDAVVVSWTYGHRRWQPDEIRDYVRHAPDDVLLCQNFEEMALEPQLGKPRLGVDYWLSCVGPGVNYRALAEEARLHGRHAMMKTQVCCSHEVASVPYVPVPGILYDKYAAAKALGTEAVMQCWYFGNYPSLMSRAAGLLAFEGGSPEGKRDFLIRLAGITWGRERAAAAADAWEEFEAGYRQLPLNVMFSYYGPMHDGPVWELALEPKNFSLPRTWQTTDPVDGDRIGECLLCGHDLDEAITLTGELSRHWEKGLELLRALPSRGEECDEQLRLAEALGILFASGGAILRFYRLRERLGLREGDPAAILGEMRALVRAEQGRSAALRELCLADGRLGYHSEGEGYKFFPEKLEHRIGQLETLLRTEFPRVEARLAAGLAPLAYYEGIEEGSRGYDAPEGEITDAPWESIDGAGAFRCAVRGDTLSFEFDLGREERLQIDPEFRLMCPYPTIILERSGKVTLTDFLYLYYSVPARELDALRELWTPAVTGRGTLLVTLPREKIGWTRTAPFKLRLNLGEYSFAEHPWVREEHRVSTLGKYNVSPGEYGWIRFTGRENKQGRAESR